MSPSIARAQLLYEQSRFDLAEQELRRAMGEHPGDPAILALLSQCLARQDKLDEAERFVEQAIVAAPDWAYSHYCRSVVLEQRRRYVEAEAASREALALEPHNADYHAQNAIVCFQQGHWPKALDAAMQGLAIDPEHETCSHLRAMALTKLGRKSEAASSVDAMLAREPDSAMAHTNKGWTLLHEGKSQPALEHFREALRIDPTMVFAQQGIVEAIKARNPVYRWMLAYFLWMARLSNGARWGVILGGYFAARLLRGVARAQPAWEPWIQPMILLYLVFVLLTWFAYPFFNLLLRLNRFGWYALSPDQRAASTWFGVCLLALVCSVVVGFGWEIPESVLIAGFALGMALPLVSIYQCDPGWPRRAMTIFTIAMALVGIAVIVMVSLDLTIATPLVTLFVIGFIATPWLANYLVSVTPTR